MFPFDIDDDEIVTEEEEEKVPSDYEINFETGKLTGRIISGRDALKQWIRITLATDRYFFTQYDWNHGSEFSKLIGRSMSQEYAESEVKRMASDALLVNENIKNVEVLSCEVTDDRVTGRLAVDTIYGKVDVDV